MELISQYNSENESQSEENSENPCGFTKLKNCCLGTKEKENDITSSIYIDNNFQHRGEIVNNIGGSRLKMLTSSYIKRTESIQPIVDNIRDNILSTDVLFENQNTKHKKKKSLFTNDTHNF